MSAYRPAPDMRDKAVECPVMTLRRHWRCRRRSSTGRSLPCREKLIKIGAKVVRHGRYITFQLAEVAASRALFDEILRLIGGLRPKPAPT